MNIVKELGIKNVEIEKIIVSDNPLLNGEDLMYIQSMELKK